MCEIVLLVYDQLDYTRNCIESILRCTAGEYRLLIIDNGSVKKETVEYLQRIASANSGRIVVHKIEKNIGYVGAVNFGLAKTQAPYVCVISNDTIVYPRWLDEMIDTAMHNSRIGLVNPQWTVPKRFIGGRSLYVATVIRWNAGRCIESDWARGFCFLVTRQLIEKIGGLDEAYAPGYFDDWDYSVRAIQAGFRCARALGAFVWHFKNVTYGLAFSTESMRDKGRIFYGRWGVPLRILLLIDRPDPLAAGRYSRLVRAVLDQQDRLAVLTTAAFPRQTPHTNLRMHRMRSRWLLHGRIMWRLWDNLRFAKSRRYDMILCSRSAHDLIRANRRLYDAYEARLYAFDDTAIERLMPLIRSLKLEKAGQYTGNRT